MNEITQKLVDALVEIANIGQRPETDIHTQQVKRYSAEAISIARKVIDENLNELCEMRKGK